MEGHEFPPEAESIHDSDDEHGDPLEESEASPLLTRKHKRLKKPTPAIHLDSDSDESVGEPGSDGSAKSAQRHIGDDSEDEDEDGENDNDDRPGGAKKKPTKRMCVIDSDDDE